LHVQLQQGHDLNVERSGPVKVHALSCIASRRAASGWSHMRWHRIRLAYNVVPHQR
jgi:hypothetical protein